MSIAAKNSRAINVDCEAYLWAVSPDSGYDVLVVQTDSGVGSKLVATIDYSGTTFTSTDANGRVAITPALVTTIIRQALQIGWQPHKNGRDLACRLLPDESIEIRTAR